MSGPVQPARQKTPRIKESARISLLQMVSAPRAEKTDHCLDRQAATDLIDCHRLHDGHKAMLGRGVSGCRRFRGSASVTTLASTRPVEICLTVTLNAVPTGERGSRVARTSIRRSAFPATPAISPRA